MRFSGTPLISVITVCFNAHEALAETVASIDSQSFVDVEHIVVDGASTDGTAAYLDTIAGLRRLVVSEPDRGLYDAMNKSLGLARGRYLHFLNAGDVYTDPNSLSRAVAHLDSAPDLLSLRAVNEFGEISSPLAAEGQRSDSTGRMEAMLFGAEALRKARFDLRYRIKSDRDAILRMILNGAKIVDRDEVIVKIEAVGVSSVKIPQKERENVQITWRNLGPSAALAKSLAGAAARLALFYPACWLGLDWNRVKRIFLS